MKLDERRRTQPEAGCVSLGKILAKELIQKQLRFEFGTGRRERNLMHAIAKIQPLTFLSRSPKQSLHPAAQIGCLADIRFALATKQEDRCRRREFQEKTLVRIRREY
jgi:hypothetical protein